MKEKRKNKREKLFLEQDGKCYYCGHKMTLINSGIHGVPPKNFATFEHLYDRFSEERNNWQEHVKNGVKRIVLACSHCNHSRAKKREREHIEEHKSRSHRPTRLKKRGGPERAIVYSTK